MRTDRACGLLFQSRMMTAHYQVMKTKHMKRNCVLGVGGRGREGVLGIHDSRVTTAKSRGQSCWTGPAGLRGLWGPKPLLGLVNGQRKSPTKVIHTESLSHDCKLIILLCQILNIFGNVVRSSLVCKKFCKIFHIPRHIESLDACMKH